LRLNKDELAAYHAAVRFLAMREYCAAELTAKLAARAHSTEVICAVLARLVADGYLSESRFAEAFLRSRMKRGETPRMAAMKARLKGVDESALQTAMDEAEAEFDVGNCCRDLINRRDPQGLRHRDEHFWQRQARFLQNKGFDAGTIVRVMNEKSDQFDD